MANNTYRKMESWNETEKASTTNLQYLHRLRRAISEQPCTTRRKSVNLHADIVFIPIEGIIAEETENTTVEQSPSADTIDAPSSSEVRIDMETSPHIKKLHPLNAVFRRIVPDHVTCQQMWLVIHIMVTVLLCGLYFARQVTFSAGSIAIVEILVGVLVRNEIFIAFLHCVIAWIPFCKYEVNRMLHCIGGLHISCAVAAFFWLIVSISYESHGLVVRITGAIILLLIIFLSSTALPVVRQRFHNTFEHIHRYVGWVCLLILIVHVIFLQKDKFDYFHTRAIFNLPVITLVLIVVIIFLPWICVRRVFAKFHQPSNDLTVITFPQALYPYGSTTRISLDGHEWHAFAIALSDACADQHSILVAVAGDWTKGLAEDYRTNKLPEQVWIRQIKGIGFMYSIHAYRKVLIVCTGSGIAPAMPYIKDPLPTTHAHLLWIAKQHELNYGDYIWQLVKKTAPHFTLHDTKINGRPGPELVEDHFWRSNAEAVFVVSNEKFTKEVVNALWRKSIPCFGALFDS